MTLVRKLPATLQNENNILKSEKYMGNSYFNPQKDINGIWIISEEEYLQMDEIIKGKYILLINLEQITFEPVPITEDAGGLPLN